MKIENALETLKLRIELQVSNESGPSNITRRLMGRGLGFCYDTRFHVRKTVQIPPQLRA